MAVLALAVAAVTFVLAKPDGDDGGDKTTPQTVERTQTDGGPRTPPRPKTTRIRIRQGAVVGGPKTIAARSGETVRIVVASDAPDELHLHGYDITREAAPRKPARFVFEAKAEGLFEMESHTAEDAGRDPLVAKVEIRPA